ncbi:FAD-dependent monooxygenase [Modestobacter sp. VKM Ac-2979]|uniref:FAD-dependent monooxygenase n=1 Tax=unclassified Modestobacter TaxID=2643866 RepID=UPI0022AB8D42|nr:MULTISPECIES: FAD-dependent monooxygenase [unclassified Modestobacter]MCZ2812048.1 FAD-dependent monooxygenase [Modestobacter sp. VKM Ac-2979]MCZ2843772.1 FAD-dependent monooxygenase [Modestobacter sp. VKM Ac-2980]
MSTPLDVLVVGAGPTGLALGLQAAAHGARVRVVDARTTASRPSRALIVHARTLEVLRPLGVVADLLAGADTGPAAELHLGRSTVPVRLGDLAVPDTAFPHLTFLRQQHLERVLTAALTDCGVRVEWATLLMAPEEGPEGVAAVLSRDGGTEVVHCAALAGCDGVDSTVRSSAGIGWPGARSRPEVVLADVDLAGDLAAGTAHVAAGRGGLLIAFALGEGAPWRLVATRTAPDRLRPGASGPSVPAGELQELLDAAGLPARVTDVAWSSRIALQHRLATAYRVGRLFLAGDAAHAWSPAGGQGMNTGIQDATALGWRLATAAASSAPEDLLDSYEAERRPVAAAMLALTRLLFWGESATDPVAATLRGHLAPLAAPLVPWVLSRRRLVARGFRVLAQLDTGYRGGPLGRTGSIPRRGRLRPGDRVPDASVSCQGRDLRLHELIARPGVHVLLDRDAPDLDPSVAGPLVHVHRLASSPGRGVVAVRPDGHAGFISGAVDPELCWWLSSVGASGA